MVDSYEKFSDEDLIAHLRQGQQELMDLLLDRYKNLVRKRANAMFLMGGENEDLIQEGMIGLFKAIRDFKPEESSFYHFADLCISRQIIHAVEAAGRKKHQPLNSYVSLSSQETEEGVNFMDMLLTMETQNPEQLLIAQEDARAVGRQLKECLSKMEKQVAEYYLSGLNYREIARLMGKSPKAIDNALQRIRGKLKAKDGSRMEGGYDDPAK